MEKGVSKKDKDRVNCSPPHLLNTVGLKKLTTTKWLQDLLTKGADGSDLEEELHTNENLMLDENYELL